MINVSKITANTAKVVDCVEARNTYDSKQNR